MSSTLTRRALEFGIDYGVMDFVLSEIPNLILAIDT